MGLATGLYQQPLTLNSEQRANTGRPKYLQVPAVLICMSRLESEGGRQKATGDEVSSWQDDEADADD